MIMHKDQTSLQHVTVLALCHGSQDKALSLIVDHFDQSKATVAHLVLSNGGTACEHTL